MARIRTIKPEFWSTPGIETLDPMWRLLYIAMWNWADDSGRGTAEARELMGFAFPRDEDMTLEEFRRGLGEVRRVFGVDFYTLAGRSYYAIPSWEKHQKIDKRSQSRHPAPEEGETYDPTVKPQVRLHNTEHSTEPAESPPSTRRDSGAGTGEQGNRGTGLYTFKSAADASNVEHDEQTPNGDQSDQKKSKKNAYPVDFEKFWQVYPRRQSKGDALKAWKQAKKQADVETIMAGAQRYADDPNRTDQYTQLAGTWLRAHGWENEPLPERHQPKTFAQQTTDNNNAALLRAVQGGGDLWSTPEEQETLRSGGRWQLGS